MRTFRPHRLGSLLSSQLGAAGSAIDPAALEVLARAGQDAAGKPLAAHARPLRYDGGRLVLAVTAPVWASRIRHEHGALLARLRQHAFFRDLAAIQVRLASAGGPRRPPPPAPPRRPSNEARALVEEIAGAVKDEKLRAALRRLARR
jgi:hypothetical protein